MDELGTSADGPGAGPGRHMKGKLSQTRSETGTEPSQARPEEVETMRSASCIGRAAHPSATKRVVPEATWATELIVSWDEKLTPVNRTESLRVDSRRAVVWRQVGRGITPSRPAP